MAAAGGFSCAYCALGFIIPVVILEITVGILSYPEVAALVGEEREAVNFGIGTPRALSSA